MQSPNRTELKRVLGRWDLTALILNMCIGSGIFGLPTIIVHLVGGASPLAFLIAGAGMLIIALCLSEVASQFKDAGGPYLYARVAFGQFVGLQIGWITWLVRISAAAANANLFIIYLGEFWKPATGSVLRFLLLTLIFCILAVINCIGVQLASRVSDFLAVLKLIPLILFVFAGLFFLHPGNFLVNKVVDGGEWLSAILLLTFAYGGFEAALIPAGEVKNPLRDAPFALLFALSLSVVVHTLVQVVVVGTLPLAAITDRPLATAANHLFGHMGEILLTLGAMVSVYGLMSGAMLNTPRLTFALAEQGDFPAFFATIHPRFRTPYVSIIIYAGLSLGLAAWGNFKWNVALSAVARLLIYASTCIAMLVFRHRWRDRPAFRVPGGLFVSVTGIAFCSILMTCMGKAELIAIGMTVLLAAGGWHLSRSYPSTRVVKPSHDA